MQWFNDSDPGVLSTCRAAVDEAVALGAELVEVRELGGEEGVRGKGQCLRGELSWHFC